MITLQSKLHLTGIQGSQITDFLLNCTDPSYQAWWPGTHLHFHTLKRYPHDLGNLVYMDEFVGNRRIQMAGIVTEALPGKRITWQLEKGILLPVWLTVELADDPAGLTLTHIIRAGFNGLGRVFDFVFRLYFTAEFERAMDEHAQTEFPKLRELLRRSEPRLEEVETWQPR